MTLDVTGRADVHYTEIVSVSPRRAISSRSYQPTAVLAVSC